MTDRTTDTPNIGTGRIHSKRAVEEDVLTLARHRAREAFDLFDTVVVSFSGGKDSTAVLNIALEAARDAGKLPLKVIFFDEEAIEPQTVEYVLRVAAREDIDLHWLCLPVQCRNACSRKHPHWWPWAPEDREKWCRQPPPSAIMSVPGFPEVPEHRPSIPDTVGLLFDPVKYGRVGMMLGIRAQESLTRTRAVLMRTPDSRPHIRPWAGAYTKGNLFKVYPIFDWATEDVWTAAKTFGWDYNRAYDAMYKSGFSATAQRIGAAFGEEPIRALWFFKEVAPEMWDKMCVRVPGASTAARYATTELYSFGTAPEKPDNMSWQEFLRFYIAKHPPEFRHEVAQRVQQWLRSHFSKTREPLAVKAAHPLTGISWNFLVNIAVRGDYKNRRQPQVKPQDYESGRIRYLKEIEAMRDAGQLVTGTPQKGATT